jgi:glycosyltransferase involved in cell wall biosynthesis
MHGEMLSLVDQKTAAGAGVADLVLGCSQFLVDRIKMRLPALADRCRTLPNGVNTERFRPRQAGPEGPPVVLYVGRLSPEKGIHVLLDAFRTVRQAIPGVTLELIGAPGLLPHAYHLGLTSDLLERELDRFYGGTLVDKFCRQLLHKDTSYIEEIGLNTTPGVCVRGALEHAHLPIAYQNAAVFAFPSVWNEPFGMPIVEAQAAGIPVVASRGGGIPEIVHDGKTGVLVDRSDIDGLAKALIRLLDDPKLRRTQGAAGRTWITSTLTWPQIGYLLEHLYELGTTCESEAQ